MNKRTLIIVLSAAAIVLIVIVLLLTRGGSPGNLATQIEQAQAGATPTVEMALRPTATPDARGMAYLLAHEDYGRRLSAVLALAQREDIPVEERAGLLVEALAAEVAAPSSDAVPVKDVSLPPGSYLRLRLTRVLSELGEDALAPARAALAEAEGLTREHLLVALAYLGDADVLPEVRHLVVSSGDVTVRMDAARALGVAGDRDAIEALMQALSDAESIAAHDSAGDYTIYPVREQAALALSNLGVQVTRGENHTFSVEGN
ncbi:MAG: HEAT repeat domain-containing protein [Anaerolineae bacterium]